MPLKLSEAWRGGHWSPAAAPDHVTSMNPYRERALRTRAQRRVLQRETPREVLEVPNASASPGTPWGAQLHRALDTVVGLRSEMVLLGQVPTTSQPFYHTQQYGVKRHPRAARAPPARRPRAPGFSPGDFLGFLSSPGMTLRVVLAALSAVLPAVGWRPGFHPAGGRGLCKFYMSAGCAPGFTQGPQGVPL